MTITNRAITAQGITKRHSMVNVTRTAPLSYTLINMSRDRTYFFAVSGTSLYRSTDDTLGTFTLIHTFGSNVQGIIELYNGEVIVSLGSGAGFSSSVSYSTGWTASQTGATWSTPYTFQGDYIPSVWGFKNSNAASNGVVLVNTYGTKTATGLATTANNISAGCRVFLSTDSGVTFTKIFDLLEANGNAAPAPNAYGTHVHCASYDQEWDRIWVAYGDNTGSGTAVAGTNNLQLIYSDDHGATWNTVAIPANYSTCTGGFAQQFTTILCTHDNVILMPDGSPFAVCTIPKTSYRTLGTFRVGPMLVIDGGAGGANTNVQGIVGQSVFQAAGDDMPIFACFNQSGSGGTLSASRVMASSNGGNDWYEILYFAQAPTDSNRNFSDLNLIGPSINGKMYGGSTYTGIPTGTWSRSLVKADLISPA